MSRASGKAKAQYDWNGDSIQWLKSLWAKGLSAERIAETMGAGLTRNAILGAVHRNNLPKRRTRVSSVRKQVIRTARRKSKAKPKTVRYQAPRRPSALNKTDPILLQKGNDTLPAASERIGIMDLKDGQCRWITGDPRGEHSFCGQQVNGKGSWCEAHQNRVWKQEQSTEVKRKDG